MKEYQQIVVRDYPEDELRELWRKEYCRKVINTFDGIRVKFYDSNFDHAFYETTQEKRNARKKDKKNQLSSVRLSRMLWIRDVLQDPDADLYEGYENKRKTYNHNKRVAVVKNNYIVVIELQKNGTATFITAYVADESIGKIRQSPKWK